MMLGLSDTELRPHRAHRISREPGFEKLGNIRAELDLFCQLLRTCSDSVCHLLRGPPHVSFSTRACLLHPPA